MVINDIQVDPQSLIPKDELLLLLRENGENDRALAVIRDRYDEKFGNELIWRYPLSDGYHLGTIIVVVREGFISLPYDTVDREDYELLELDDASILNDEAIKCFIDDWQTYSDDLISAMTDMRRILRGE